MDLHFQELGSTSEQPIIILHGLFGSLDNWSSIGRQLSETQKVYLLDQRNHGKSAHSPQWDYRVMVQDLVEFITSKNIHKPIILGHSMGGKVAMFFACTQENLLSKLIVADMAPKYYPPHHQTILEGLQSIPIRQIANRQEAEETLKQHIKSVDTRQFLLKSLHRNHDNTFSWRFNLEVISKEIENIGEALPADLHSNVPSLFIRGGLSDYVNDQDMEEIHQHFSMATIETIAGAGHWLHAEKPKEFIEAVSKFIEE